MARAAAAVVAGALFVAGCATQGAPTGPSDSSTPVNRKVVRATPGTTDSRFADFASSPQQRKAWRKFTASLRGKWQGKTLRIIDWYDNAVPATNRLVPQFEQLTGAKVVYERYEYDVMYIEEAFLAHSRMSSPDIIVVDMPWVGKFAAEGFVEPLEPYFERTPKALLDYEDLFGVMREGARWKGKTIGLPYAPYFIMNIYNKKLLKRAGVAPPRDFAELVRVAKAVTEKVEGAYGIAMNNQTGTVIGQAYYEYIYNMGGKPFASEYPGSPDYYADMTPQFTSPQSLAVLRLFKTLLQYEPPGGMNMTWPLRFNAFAAGNVALMSPWNYHIPPLSDPRISRVAGEHAVQPLYHKRDVRLNTPVGGWELGINPASPNKDLAWDYMIWFTSPQIGAQFAALGGFPARYSVLRNRDLVRQYPYYKTLQKVANTSFPAFRPQIPESFDVIQRLGTWMSKAMFGELGEGEAMERANQDIGQMLKDAGYRVRGF